MNITRFTAFAAALFGGLAILLSSCSADPPAAPLVPEMTPAEYYMSAERHDKLDHALTEVGTDLLHRMQSGEIASQALSYFNSDPAPQDGYGRLVSKATYGKFKLPIVTLFVRFSDGQVADDGVLGFQIISGQNIYTLWGKTSLTVNKDREVIVVDNGPLSYQWMISGLGESEGPRINMRLYDNDIDGVPPQDTSLKMASSYSVILESFNSSWSSTTGRLQPATEMLEAADGYFLGSLGVAIPNIRF